MSARSSLARTVLLVDDTRLLRTMIAEHLNALGYSVLVAPSGEEALRLAAGHEGPIDVLLTDVHMPGMAGPELAERLKSSSPQIRIVFMSGTGGGALAGKVLVKPFTQEQLAEALTDAR